MYLAAELRCCRPRGHGAPLLSPLLFLSWILPRSSFAQLVGDTDPSLKGTPPTTFLTSTFRPDPSTTTLLPTETPVPPPAAFGNHSSTRESSLVNLYFLLLFLAAAALVSIYYVVRRRRKEKSARSRSRGHNALVRDLASWPGANRSHTGGRRGLGNASGTEEGLNERGEAPPPYELPPPILPRDQQPGGGQQEPSGVSFPEATPQLAIPMRALTHAPRVQPPGYDESINDTSLARPATGMSTSRLLPTNSYP